MAPFEPGPLIERLVDTGVEFVIVGGFAVIAHGYVRATRDLDIVPAPTRENYERLAALRRGVEAEQLGVDAHLLPNQPTDPAGGTWRGEADAGLVGAHTCPAKPRRRART